MKEGTMKEEITYSKALYAKMMEAKKRANRVQLVLAVIFFIVLRIKYVQSPVQGQQANLWTGILLMVFFLSIIFTAAYLYAEQHKAKNSGLIYYEGTLQYTYLKSNGNATNNGGEVYRKYVIETIDSVTETKTNYIVTGSIDCVDSGVGGFRPRDVKFVKIPKYFEGLESILNEIRSVS